MDRTIGALTDFVLIVLTSSHVNIFLATGISTMNIRR